MSASAIALASGPRATLRSTVRRAVTIAPEFTSGLGLTVVFALIATLGRIVIPIVVQQVLDRGLRGGVAHPGTIRLLVALGGLAMAVTIGANFAMNTRLFRATEGGLAHLRIAAFRHVHDLSVLHQETERRGSLVSRVTSDVDTISVFVQYSGIFLVVAGVQLILAAILMGFYSWPLMLLVLLSFAPAVYVGRRLQRRLTDAYGVVRKRVGEMLGAIAESVVGAGIIQSYGIQDRTAQRIDAAVENAKAAQTRAQKLSVGVFIFGEVGALIANVLIVLGGVWLGVGGHLSLGRFVAFLFLVNLFVQPVQIGTEALNEAQNAIASFHRVVEVLDTPTDITDPGQAGTALPSGPLGIAFRHVRFAYGDGPEVLHDIDLEIAPRTNVAIVGETGGGKTTFAKLLTRLMDPTSGRVEIGGVPLTEVPFSSLRARVVVVPQDGYLFDMSVADNVRHGRADLTDEDVTEVFANLGLADWLATLPAGVATRVGQRGESLSAGERQLVALARAYVADPDLLVLDEATSAVDPATEQRIARALDEVTRGRTAVTIAHRLSTAEVADEVLVIDAGHIVARGPHAQVLAEGGVYARLYASWSSQRET